jgi:hypothetical protein
MSSPPVENISVFRNKQFVYGSPIPPSQRGALRDRHERWVRDAMDALAQLTNAAKADGKGVWS